MNIVIVGQGAIGLLCYHRLSQAIINQQGDNLVSLWPSTPTTLSDYFFSEINDVAKSFPLTMANNQLIASADVIIFCVKSYQVTAAMKAVDHLISDNAVIILTHNGLGTLEEINSRLKPSQCLLALLLTQGAKKVAPYHIKHTGMGHSDLGIIYGTLHSIKQKQLLELLNKSLKQLSWQENIQQAQWKKLAINCVINPISALNDIENGEVNQKAYQRMTEDIISEVVAVATKEGEILSEILLRQLIHNVAKSTNKNTSSMRADVLNKRRTEIEYINGYIHRLGEKHQLTTAINTQLWLAVKALEDKYLPE
ncbi:MAG: 2-dehydropantoate 2-reductase [Colwellia sp.]|jgi:2-dehydropantoate 2-reductase|uniref:ketopantoate reductase family protein n=1 Tax=unclassified Colwellia TaxID=196834 RepID=UPI0015F38D70|nr:MULTISPECIES: 2-dehydropantoate 2-reductase [unclassified Colwellia]MBA6252358.1 2-dehydropantoate 2-reductase [Colwellia sp. MB3u-55]MBA6396987.1 2-dehydropantoate 2-reductase [Colwellia sp. BRX10-4]